MMSSDYESCRLPPYSTVAATIDSLELAVSTSELHGLFCGYLCAGNDSKGESYIQALRNKKDKAHKEAILLLFSLYSISQQQIQHFDFAFELLIPNDEESPINRAQCFSEWCEGFTQGLALAGIGKDDLHDEEAQEALFHIREFAKLDYDAISIGEDDERSLMEVIEYTRMAVIRLYSEFAHHTKTQKRDELKH